MAVFAQRRRLLVMILATFAPLVTGADCGAQCALCANGRAQQSGISVLACSLQCKGWMNTENLRLCQNLMFGKEDSNILDADSDQSTQQQGLTTKMADSEASPEHQIAKKYGGFMKRFGDPMSPSSSSAQGTLYERERQDEKKNMGILKILGSMGDNSKEGDSNTEEAAKRYSLNHPGKEVTGSGKLFEIVSNHGLMKRYGGFMRRVGRPEWLVEESNRNGAANKLAWDNGSGLQKRYGGFMD